MCVFVCVFVCAKPASINEVCCIADVFAPVCSRTFIVPPFGVCMFFRKEREIQELAGELMSMGVSPGGTGMVMVGGGRYA